MMTIRLLALCAVCMWLTGCGTVHVGSTTHTHIYGKQHIETDDPIISRFQRIATFLKGTTVDDAAPLKDFDWNEQMISAEERRQREQF